MSLKEFLRKRLMLGSQYPSVEEEAENYLREIEEHMIATRPSKTDLPCDYRSFDGFKDGYAVAVERMLKFLRNGELEATET
jgi:hypothetical protein